MVARESSRARAIPSRSPLISVMPALAMATSVPVPIAMPTSAVASAGASLMPSPAMATMRPSRRNRSTTALFRSGSTSASISVIPSRCATAAAVAELSPVSMTMRSPSARSRSSAFWRGRLDRIGNHHDAGGLSFDGEKNRAGAVAPPAVGIVFERTSRNRMFGEEAALPSATLRPSTTPATPLPGKA